MKSQLLVNLPLSMNIVEKLKPFYREFLFGLIAAMVVFPVIASGASRELSCNVSSDRSGESTEYNCSMNMPMYMQFNAQPPDFGMTSCGPTSASMMIQALLNNKPAEVSLSQSGDVGTAPYAGPGWIYRKFEGESTAAKIDAMSDLMLTDASSMKGTSSANFRKALQSLMYNFTTAVDYKRSVLPSVSSIQWLIPSSSSPALAGMASSKYPIVSQTDFAKLMCQKFAVRISIEWFVKTVANVGIYKVTTYQSLNKGHAVALGGFKLTSNILRKVNDPNVVSCAGAMADASRSGGVDSITVNDPFNGAGKFTISTIKSGSSCTKKVFGYCIQGETIVLSNSLNKVSLIEGLSPIDGFFEGNIVAVISDYDVLGGF